MANSEAQNELSGNPCDASGKITFFFDAYKAENQVKIEKIIGIFIRETNIVLKFRLVLTVQQCNTYALNIVYVSEEKIDCYIKIEIKNLKVWINEEQSFENMFSKIF